jgi:L-amino acid N-acyltransferase YncA
MKKSNMPNENPRRIETAVIRDASAADAERICGIYAPYVLKATATFELEPPSAGEMVLRMQRVKEKHAWLVAEEEGTVLGYAYGSPVRDRAAYAHSTEVTVYVDVDFCGRGLGRLLYEKLLARLRSLGYVQAIGCIALPNPGSVRLHESFGFKKAAHLKQVGYKFGRWIDVEYWQKQIGDIRF